MIRAGHPNDAGLFIRGDANRDGRIDISDAITTLSYLFLGGSWPASHDAADTDDNGRIDMTDAIVTLGHLYLGGPPPAPPHPAAGEDPTPDDLPLP